MNSLTAFLRCNVRLALTAAAFATPARAAVTVIFDDPVESSTYAAGNGDGQNGWSAVNGRPLEFVIQPSAIVSPTAGETGDHFSAAGNRFEGLQRPIDLSPVAAGGLLRIDLTGRFRFGANSFETSVSLVDAAGNRRLRFGTIKSENFVTGPAVTNYTSIAAADAADAFSSSGHQFKDVRFVFDPATGDGTLTTNDIDGGDATTTSVIAAFTSSLDLAEITTLEVASRGNADQILAINVAAVAIPEPSSAAAVIGFGGVAAMRRRRRRCPAP